MQVVNDVLLLGKDIDIGWLFVGKVDLEEEGALQNISKRRKDNLVEFHDCQFLCVMTTMLWL